jgi:hypothetical protein
MNDPTTRDLARALSSFTAPCDEDDATAIIDDYFEARKGVDAAAGRLAGLMGCSRRAAVALLISARDAMLLRSVSDDPVSALFDLADHHEKARKAGER